jgi:hypothetical protein
MVDVTEMETLPYFLLLLKKNALLCSIIATGSFAKADLSQTQYRIHSDQAIDFFNFSLGENETFTSVKVLIVESGTSITFFTNSSKYFEEPERYFRQMDSVTNHIYTLNQITSQTTKKSLGDFIVLPSPVPPASVWVRNSSVYGYAIAVSFFTHNASNPPTKDKN